MYSPKTQAAIDKYGRENCLKAYRYNRVDGEGPRTIAWERDCGPNIKTPRQANAAIDAGWEIVTKSPMGTVWYSQQQVSA